MVLGSGYYGLVTDGSIQAAYEHSGLALKIVQTAAILEIFHAAAGLVRSPVVVTTMQICSRLWIVWLIIELAPAETTTSEIPILALDGTTYLRLSYITLITCWSFADMIRYAFYAFKEAGMNPYVVLWLRYSGFIILYPYGVASELTMVYFAYNKIVEEKLLTIEMPNKLNFSFIYPLVIQFVVFFYPLGLFHLYTYMLKARKKALAPPSKKTE